MLELLVYAVIFAIGTVLGMYVRRQAVIDFKAGLIFGLAEATAIAEKLQPRHQNHQPRKDQNKN